MQTRGCRRRTQPLECAGNRQRRSLQDSGCRAASRDRTAHGDVHRHRCKSHLVPDLVLRRGRSQRQDEDHDGERRALHLVRTRIRAEATIARVRSRIFIATNATIRLRLRLRRDKSAGGIMNSRFALCVGAAALASTLTIAVAAQSGGKRDFDAEYRTAVQTAKDAAGFQWLGTLVRTCLLPQSGGENTNDNVPDFVTDTAKAPPRDSWYAEPAKVFDDVYFVGGKIHSSWALTTREGIILIDTLFPYNSEQLIVGGMQKLGLDPKQIKYLIISHAHTDHIGGAEIIQKKFGARVVMGGTDWDTVAEYPNR